MFKVWERWGAALGFDRGEEFSLPCVSARMNGRRFLNAAAPSLRVTLPGPSLGGETVENVR
jgi:hypothetical protein